MMEIALAKFPFPIEAMTTYFDMMQFITEEQSPTLPAGMFSEAFEEFCVLTLAKDEKSRAHPKDLLESRFIRRARDEAYDLKEWTSELVKKSSPAP